MILNPTDELLTATTYYRSDSILLKGNSMNNKCVFFQDTNSAERFFLYNVVEKRHLPTDNGINKALFSGIDFSTASIDISNDCLAVRINNQVFHTDLWTTKLALDYLPNSLTTILSPGFSPDFSLMVTNDAISVYVPKNSSSSSNQYVLSRNDSFYALKNIQRFGNYFVVFSQEESTTPGKWNFKLQFNILSGTSSKKIAEYTHQTTGKSLVYMSPRLTKIIVAGMSFSNQTAPFYLIKTIDFDE